MSSRAFFDDVADALIGFLPPDLRDFGSYRTGHNLKVWFGDDRKEHYEVQLLSRRLVGGKGRSPALEVGFHAEHADAAANDAVLERLGSGTRTWRKALGKQTETGAFIGQQSGVWRRVSEVWVEDGSTDPDAAIEAAERLADYIRALEPVRRKARR